MENIIPTKIIIGLLITLTFGFIVQIINRTVERKVEEMSKSKKVGVVTWFIIMVIYYVSMFFYWIGLLNESLE